MPDTIYLSPGGLCVVVRPDPIPNSEVKRFSGDDNAWATVCENISPPYELKASLKDAFFYSSSINSTVDTS